MTPVNLCLALVLLTLVSLATSDTDDHICQNEIPLEMAKRLSETGDEEEFFREFFEPETPALEETFGTFLPNLHHHSKRSIIISPKRQPASTPKPRRKLSCEPELRTISLREPGDDRVYYPECDRLERCAGCCNNRKLSCRPVKTENVTFTVFVKERKGEKPKEMKIVKEKHIKCRCDCKIKAEDCKEGQAYNETSCSCYCPNKTEKAKCKNDPSKHWDSTSCSCGCEKVIECSSGSYFNHTSCGCERLHTDGQTSHHHHDNHHHQGG